MNARDERDVSYLKLLQTLKVSSQGLDSSQEGADLGVVRRLAAWIDSEPVLQVICTHPRWYDDWEIKESLLRNDASPVKWRGDLERSIAIFDLLREMDDASVGPDEKAEIQDDIKHLFKTLPERDRQVVKQRAHSLVSRRKEAEPQPGPAAVFARSATAPASPVDPDDFGDSGSLLAAEFDASVDLRARMGDGSATDILHSFELNIPEPTFRVPAPPPQAQASEAPWQPVTARTPASAPVVLPPPLQPPERGAPASAAPAAVALPSAQGVETGLPGIESDAVSAEELDSLPDLPPAVTGPQLAALSVPQKAQVAISSPDHQLLQALAYETADEIVLALLDNPALGDRTAAIIARRANGRVAAELYRRRRIFMRPLVRAAFLECPHAPSAALLEAVGSISDAGEILRVLKSPKIKFLEVKAKARAKLANQFRGNGVAEKLSLIRRLGAPLIKELWTDFFRDEALVTACVEQQALDYGIILEIARSRVAPRKALEAIGNSRAWTSHYPIVLELVLNPKTPRPIAAKLVPKLNPSDRQMVRNNAALPEALRRFA